jgi:hypothetical protein
MALPRMPGPDEEVLHVHTAEGQHGPLSRRGLVGRLAAGTLSEQGHLWMKGMDAWEAITDHREALAAGLDAGPAAPAAGPAAPAAAPAAAPTPEVADGPPVAAAPALASMSDDALDAVFAGLVKESWKWLGDQRFASQIDEVFLGAVITSTLDTGFVLIDLSSDGSHHFLRFEDLTDRSRILFRLTHLTPSLAVSKVLGQRASVVIGYGERIGNIAKVFTAIQSEMKSSFLKEADPGTITVDGDLNSGYVYCNVDLFLDIDAYVSRDYRVDHAKLSTHVAGTVHALRKYLRGRFK